MVVILGLLQFAIVGIICIYEFKLKSPMVFMWATLFIMFGVMHLLASLVGDLEYSNDVLNEASLFAILFCCFYLWVRFVFSSKIEKNNNRIFAYGTLKKQIQEQNVQTGLLFACVLFVLAGKLIPFIRYAGNILSTSWGVGRAYSASLSYVNSGKLVNIAFYMVAGAIAVFWINGNRKLAVGCIALFGMNIIVTRNRIEVLPIVCSLIFLYLLRIRRLEPKTIIGVIITAVAVIYIIYGLRVFRHYGSIEAFLTNFDLFEFIEKINYYIMTGDGELDLRRHLYYFISRDNNFTDFGKGHSYIRMLLVYLPTGFSGGIKPDDFAIKMGAAAGWPEGGSIHPTLFGDCYANLGFWGIFLGVFWAAYAVIMDKAVISGKKTTFVVLKYILIAVTNVIIARGSIYNAFWFVAYGLPALIVIEYIISHFRIKI